MRHVIGGLICLLWAQLSLGACGSGGLASHTGPREEAQTRPPEVANDDDDRAHDRDGDGIRDDDDACPTEPEDLDEFMDEDGCPDPDNDQDRIPDQVDACPNDPEVYNGHEDDDGCPDLGCTPPPYEPPEEGAFGSPVRFSHQSSAIESDAAGLLDALAAVITGNPQLGRVRIEGHASAEETNAEALGIRRARAVVRALVQRGVPRDRLRPLSRGSSEALNQGTDACNHEDRRVVSHVEPGTENGE